MEDLIIFDKSSGDIMKDYFGVPLKTTVEVSKDIDNGELKFELEKCGNEL
jgi:hypothetical protein